MLLVLRKALIDLVFLGELNFLELLDDVAVERLSLPCVNGNVKALLEFLLKEDVQLSLHCVLLLLCDLLGSRVLLDLLNSKSHDGLLETISELLVFWLLGEFCQESAAPLLSHDLLLLGLDGKVGDLLVERCG